MSKGNNEKAEQLLGLHKKHMEVLRGGRFRMSEVPLYLQGKICYLSLDMDLPSHKTTHKMARRRLELKMTPNEIVCMLEATVGLSL